MPLSLSCPACHKTYNAPDTLAGKQVRCQKCSHVFTAAAPTAALQPAALQPAALQPAALQPAGLDPLFADDLPPLGPALPSAASLPAAGLGTPLSPEGRPLGYAPAAADSPYAPSALRGPGSRPPEGPTDSQFRWGSAGAVVLGLAMAGLCVASIVFTDSVFLWPLFIAPLLVLLGIAGLIDPNITRSLGKYGKHLPLHYKLIGWSLMAVWLVIVIILVIAMVNLGFRPGR